MTENSTIHWTDDNELLSMFVLGRLGEPEEGQLRKHLDACEQCRGAVKRESLIAGGTRLAAREALKHRLQENLAMNEQQRDASAPQTRVTRYRIAWRPVAGLAAAALLIIVVGVYNDWFGTDHRQTPPSQESLVQEQPQRGPESSQSSQDTPRSTGAMVHKSLRGDAPVQSKGHTREVYADKRVRKTVDLGENVSGNEQSGGEKTSAETAAPPRTNADEGRGAARAATSESETRVTDQAMIPPPQAFWIEGHIITPRTTSEERSQPLPAPKTGNYSLLKQDRAEAGKDLEGQRTPERGTAMINVSLRQKPTSSLPPALRRRLGTVGAIQTFVENDADTILMTLFLESPVPDSSLRSENIELLGSDSLIIHLPNRRITLTLPPALVGQVKSKAKR